MCIAMNGQGGAAVQATPAFDSFATPHPIAPVTRTAALARPASSAHPGAASAAVPSGPSRALARLRWELRVLGQLGLREVRLQYRGTALGLLWAVASPLAMGAVYIGLFSGVMGAGGASYPRELLAGLIPWSGFAAALCAAAHAPRTHAALLRGHRVPVRVLVGAAAAAAVPGLLAGLLLLVAWAMLSGSGISPAALAALPALVALMLALATAAALPLALANALLRDTQHALHYALRLAFFLTPVVWLPEHLPARLAPLAGLVAANPLAGLTAAFRDVLASGHAPAAAPLAPALIWTLLLAAVGLVAERKLGRRIAEVL